MSKTRTIDDSDVLVVTRINATKGWAWDEHDERLTETYFVETDEEGRQYVDEGEVYRACLKEYGRPISRVYVDDESGKPKPVGWVFVKRERYDDTGEPFLAETWVAWARRNPRWTY